MIYSKYYSVNGESSFYCFICLIELKINLESSTGICNNCNYNIRMISELDSIIIPYNRFEIENKITKALSKII